MTAHNRDTVLDAVRVMLTACLTGTVAGSAYSWYSPATALVLEPDTHAAPSQAHFSVRVLTHAVRDSMTGNAGTMGQITDFVHSNVMITAVGADAYDALSYILWFWNTDDAEDARAAVATAGYMVVFDDPEITEIQEFLETAYDLRGTTTCTVGCLRVSDRVTVDTNTVAVTGNVDDDLAISATVSMED